jgi:hypothetical protein
MMKAVADRLSKTADDSKRSSRHAPLWMRHVLMAAAAYNLMWGAFNGNGLRMPRAFLLNNGDVLKAFRHDSAADRPDYVKLASLPESCEIRSRSAGVLMNSGSKLP